MYLDPSVGTSSGEEFPNYLSALCQGRVSEASLADTQETPGGLEIHSRATNPDSFTPLQCEGEKS